jgi:hypothetical protein
MKANRCLVHSHWERPLPHSVIRCLSVSGILHMLQVAFGAMRILWRRSRVGTMS